MDVDIQRVVLELKPSANLDSKLFKLKTGKAEEWGVGRAAAVTPIESLL